MCTYLVGATLAAATAMDDDDGGTDVAAKLTLESILLLRILLTAYAWSTGSFFVFFLLWNWKCLSKTCARLRKSMLTV